MRAALLALALLPPASADDAVETITVIANYVPASDVTQHARIDLDVRAMSARAGAGAFDEAWNYYANGEYSTKGEGLRSDQLTLEAEAAVRIRRIEADFGAFEREKQAQIDDERDKFEQSLAAVADKANLELEMRTRELERTKEQRRAEIYALNALMRERDQLRWEAWVAQSPAS